MADNILEEIFQ